MACSWRLRKSASRLRRAAIEKVASACMAGWILGVFRV
jgi:hypothetical protein